MGTEAAGCHDRMTGTAQFQQVIEALFGNVRGGGGGEARPPTAAGVGGQGELTDQQQAAAGLGQRAVHPSLRVGEHPIVEQAFGHSGDPVRVVVRLDGDQGQQAGANPADDFAIDLDAGFGDALDQADHGVELRDFGCVSQVVGWAGYTLAVSARVLAEVIVSLIWLLGRLPAAVRRGLAWAGAGLWTGLALREFKVARRNFELIQPLSDRASQTAMARAAVHGMALNFFDTLSVWSRSTAANLGRIRERHDEARFLAALADPRGLIVAAPHYGNWELLNQYLASRSAIDIVYRVPESTVADALLRRVRGRHGIVQVRAEAVGVRRLFRTLRAGGTVGILPDQQPKLGDGVFAPFFGVEALTMTLIHRLAVRTGAQVLLAFAERRSDGDFDLHFRTIEPDIAGTDPVRAATVLNRGVQAIAERDFRQYQWTYKRYTLRPPDSGEGNPYWPDCYSRRARRRHPTPSETPP